MIRLRRKLLIDTLVLGVGMTLLVIVADQLGLLANLDNWFYDQRALRFQQFAPSPTTQLVHLDIDDRALEVLGAWPWPRSQLAAIFDELGRANPKVVASDIIFPEPQKVSFEPKGDGTFERIDHDALLAAALQRLHFAIVPEALFYGKNVTSPVATAIIEAFTENLELTTTELVDQVRRRGISGPDAEKKCTQLFYPLRREAAFLRIYELLAAGSGKMSTRPATTRPEDAVRAMLPASAENVDYSSPLTSIIREQFGRATAIRALQPLTAPLPANAPPVRTATGSFSAPILPFARASRGTGYVDFTSDGVVRNVPLLAAHDGRLYPQLGLAVALAMLDQDLRAVRFTSSAIIILLPNGREIRIPVRTGITGVKELGVPLLMDIPWIGNRDWETMYDAPYHREQKQHVGILALWQALQTENKIRKNADEADSALLTVLAATHIDQAKNYEQHRPAWNDSPARVAAIEKALNDRDVKDNWSTWSAYSPDQQDDDLRKFIAAFKQLNAVLPQARQFQDQLTTQRSQLARDFGGKAVLVGWTATAAIADFVPTPLHDRCPGVVVHGAVFNAIMTGHFWRRAPAAVVILITLLLGLATAASAVSFSATRGLLCAIGLLIAYLLINGLLLFGYFNLLTGVAAPVLTIAFVWAMCTLYRIIVETREREHMKARFQTYVDPMLVDYLLEHPEKASLEGEVKEMTVVFTDLANFTALAERIGERSVTLLNEYMARMVPIIRGHRGYLNKFLGDGIMCFYGAPADSHTHAADAVRTALGMQSAMAPFNEKFTGGDLPALAVRVGISTGNMVVGDAGAPDASDFTVLGDAVNLGSRLEGANKIFGTHVMISAETAAKVANEFLLRPLGRLQVVGKTQGVDVFEPLAPIERATDHQKRTVELTKTLVDAFKSRQFQVCIDATHALDQHAGGTTKFTRVYRELSERYLQESPPPEWHGTISLTDK